MQHNHFAGNFLPNINKYRVSWLGFFIISSTPNVFMLMREIMTTKCKRKTRSMYIMLMLLLLFKWLKSTEYNTRAHTHSCINTQLSSLIVVCFWCVWLRRHLQLRLKRSSGQEALNHIGTVQTIHTVATKRPLLLHLDRSVCIHQEEAVNRVNNELTLNLPCVYLHFRATNDTQSHPAAQPPCPPGSAGDATSSYCTPYESQRPRTCRKKQTHKCAWVLWALGLFYFLYKVLNEALTWSCRCRDSPPSWQRRAQEVSQNLSD